MKKQKAVLYSWILESFGKLTWVLLVRPTAGFCSSLSDLLSPSRYCICGLRPAGEWVGGALPLATVDMAEFDSLSTGDASSLVDLGGCTMVRLALGSWGCSSAVVTVIGFVIVAEPSPSPFAPTESVVTAFFFRQRLTPRSAFPLLRLGSLFTEDAGTCSCGCEECILDFSENSKATGFSNSFLVSMGTASFSFFLDWRRKKHFILSKNRLIGRPWFQ